MALSLPLYPLINGIRYDWSCVEIVLPNYGPVVGIKEISYSHNLEPGEARGTAPQAIGRTRGVYSAEASITLYKYEYAALISGLGNGYLEKSFDIPVNYSDTGLAPVTDKILGCRIKKPENSHSQSGDALVVKVDLHVMLIIENGINPLVKTLGV